MLVKAKLPQLGGTWYPSTTTNCYAYCTLGGPRSTRYIPSGISIYEKEKSGRVMTGEELKLSSLAICILHTGTSYHTRYDLMVPGTRYIQFLVTG